MDRENIKRITTIKTDRVAELRSKLKLSRQAFADACGISSDMVKKLETKERGLSLDVALKIAEGHNVSVGWLFGGEETPNTNFLMDLRKIFKITFSEKVYESQNGTVQIEYPTLSIDKGLALLIKEMESAEKLKSDGKIPEYVFEHWVGDINNKCKNLLLNCNDEDKEPYICVADNWVADLILNAAADLALLKEVVNTMGRKEFIDDLKHDAGLKPSR